MKTRIWICLLFMSCSVWGQPEISKKFLDQINLVRIASPNSYMFKYEVSNFAYKEMMYHAAQKDSSIYYQMLPDTTVWRTPLGFNEKYVEYYFQHPAYRDYPVVGVSYEQAQLYCDMLTDIFNTKILSNNAELEEVVFRLPCEKEWEAAARAGHPFAVYPWKEEGVRQAKTGQILANFVRGNGDYMGVAGSLNDGADVTAPVESYWPNDFGLYNMSGNVAEMVSEKGIAKGGGWIHGALNLIIDSANTFDSPQPWLGFRYVMEVVKFRDAEKKPQELNAKLLEKTLVYTNTIGLYSWPEYYEKIENTQPKPFYTSYIETPNAWYNIFLSDIKNSNPVLYNKCLPADSLWMNETSILNFNFYSTQQQFSNYPVVNITKDAALSFCSWLSERYNNDANRKYKKVLFSLPLELELVALQIEFQNDYFMFRPRYEKGTISYNLNIHPYDERYYGSKGNPQNGSIDNSYYYPENDSTITRGLDGYELLAPIKGFPRDKAGMYNLFGNASEMISNKDYSLGGSWASCLYYNDSIIKENEPLPSPKVGFRLVMHVIEE